jgi:hypothetical protein
LCHDSFHLVDDSFVLQNIFYPLDYSSTTRFFAFFDGGSGTAFVDVYRENNEYIKILPRGGIIMKTEHKGEQIGCATGDSICCKRAEVPSDEEVAALRDMRDVKARVKELKKRQSEISLHQGEYLEEKSRLEKEMTELKIEWSRLEEKRKKAAHERMILLGHDKS